MRRGRGRDRGRRRKEESERCGEKIRKRMMKRKIIEMEERYDN